MESFEYDKFGRLAKQTSFEGIVTTYYYDSYGRLETKKFFDNQAAHLAGTPAETWTYTYDALGRVVKIDQNGRVTQTVYDAQGRTVSIQTPEGTISYTYDEFGRQASVLTDNDPPTCYTYDQFGRLATVSSDGVMIRYEYDAYGVVVQKFWMALKIPESRPKTEKTKKFIVQNKFRHVNI